MTDILLIIILATQIIFFLKLNKIQKDIYIALESQLTIFNKLNKIQDMAESAEETLDSVMTEIGEIITILESIFVDDGSDLTADEVRAKTLDAKTRLQNLANR